jgi:hypothetical protein
MLNAADFGGVDVCDIPLFSFDADRLGAPSLTGRNSDDEIRALW